MSVHQVEPKPTWASQVIKRDEVTRYLQDGRDFIDDAALEGQLASVRPDAQRVRDILQKSLAVESLTTEETATLLNVADQSLWEEMYDVAAQVKRKVYDNRVVTFAPIYCSDLCVNNCLYCGFRAGNSGMKRRCLTMEEIAREAEVLAGQIGHKRLILVFGEHPRTDARYIAEAMRTVYAVEVPTRTGSSTGIRRLNINAAPMSIDDLRLLQEVGMGTFQVFQETYHHDTYAKLHPHGTVKSDYAWRITCMHRAMESGVDDVGIGALFGLYDWRFEVMGLVAHARELEARFGIGPHTISFPRLTPALDTPFVQETRYRVSDEEFKRLVCVLRLSVPYTGMIITVRERPEVIRECIPMCTQRDASTRIGVGAYQDKYEQQEADRQQFTLGDTTSLDSVIRELAEMGYITSFCTAGYRCGRTGNHIMDLLRSGKEGCFCKLNAILTFREWLDDFASPETAKAGERIIQKEIEEARDKVPEKLFRQLMAYYERTSSGEKDLYF
ncbi:MAG TPA: [FeFe] hydrogenase H-cluster radical SAM maturase HydG [Armatimonadetes bacterium]|jgi:2-iminoacetate synthase|nr:[FeFe] hydrogenase H-cluster radical SAM maturase HydG [Armatimonadota bacterium]